MRTRRRRVVRARRKTAWLAGANSLCSSRLNVQACDAEVQDPPDLFLILDNPQDAVPGQVESVSEITSLRIVGDLWYYSTINAAAAAEPQHITFSFHSGIYLADQVSQGGTVLDPSLSADASSKDWLWRNLTMHGFSSLGGAIAQSGLTPISHADRHPHLDITVKRKVRKQEALVLAVKVVTDNPFPSGTHRTLDTAHLYADLRVLVALP